MSNFVERYGHGLFLMSDFVERYGHGLFLMSKLIKTVTDNFSTAEGLHEVGHFNLKKFTAKLFITPFFYVLDIGLNVYVQ